MQPQAFRDHIMAVLPIGSKAELSGGEQVEVLFHTENMEHELDGLRIKFEDGNIEDVRYSDVVSPEWEQPRMGRPSQGRSFRLQAAITPELASWLEAQKQSESLSDVAFRLLDGLRQANGTQQ